MKSFVWGGKDLKIWTLLKYTKGTRAGKPHGGIDIGTPIGTPLYSPFNATVLAVSDGVPNNTAATKRYSGMPSNYVFLEGRLLTTFGNYQTMTLLVQHMSPGIPIKKGDRLPKGTYIGKSGNSGNSDGPHTHFGAQWVRRGTTPTKASRYDHVSNAELRIWPPTRYLPEVM